jgi:ribosomal protein S12 methylthiotransferase
MYLHPANIDDELIDAIAAAPSVVRYLDIPVQHASTRILKKMGRRIARTKLERLFERLRERLPGLFVRTTVLVGFPGETKDDFRQAMDFIRDVRPERFGVFTYSDEEDTRAIRMRNKVPAATATRRRRTLEELREEIVGELIESQQGQLIECIVDASAGEAGAETAIGRTYGDAPEVDYRILVADKEVRPGDIVTCRVVGRAGNNLVGAVE